MIRWLNSDTSIFGSFDIRDNFIKNLKKFSEIPIDKACLACGIEYSKFYRAYLDKAHPDPVEVSGACKEYQFKNLLNLYGINIGIKVEVSRNLSQENINEINGLIGERTKKDRITGRKSN